MSTDELLVQCFLHFVYLDRSNAAIHCAPVRYSPITFRLAEELEANRGAIILPAELVDVLDHAGTYSEDSGR